MVAAELQVASLDPKTSRIVLGYLKTICKEEGIAVICNLHQVDYAVEFAERIVGLSGGKVVFDEDPAAAGLGPRNRTAFRPAAHFLRMHAEKGSGLGQRKRPKWARDRHAIG